MGNYYLYCIARRIVRALPRPAAYAFAVFLADCHYAFSTADRRAVAANLKAILKTDHVPAAMVRDVFRNFGKYLTEFFIMTKQVNADFIRNHVHIKNSEYVNEALKHGKGCIMISAHVGNWEMAGAVLTLLGYPLSVLALPHKDQRVNKFFNAQREHFGAIVIPTTSAIRRCLEHARDNRVVAILADRDFGNHGLLMDFLGRPTKIPKGAALFSLKTGAPIISCFFMREEGGNFSATFSKPIFPPAANSKVGDAEIKPLIKQYIHMIEDQIRQYPTQWLMFREFWAS